MRKPLSLIPAALLALSSPANSSTVMMEQLIQGLADALDATEPQYDLEWSWNWSDFTNCWQIMQGNFNYDYFMEGLDAKSRYHTINMNRRGTSGSWDYKVQNTWSDPPYDPYNPLQPRQVGWNFSVAPGEYTWTLTLDDGYIVTSSCMFVPADENGDD